MRETYQNSKWHVLYTKPRHEIKALERLAQKGFEVYCPMKTILKQWSDRKKKVSEPLLPSYIFIKVTEKKRAIPLKDPSVLNYIFWLGKPAIVRESEIDTLKGIISKDKVQEFEIRQLNIGDKIDIHKGQIKSKNAIIKTISNNYITAELKELGMTIVLKKTDLLA
ncbi:UpxY family transcription antiterminator [bacterium]|nr:UpxY family transcription antiterminator [bacterium]